MNYYQSRIGKISGSNYLEVRKEAESIFKQIKSKTKTLRQSEVYELLAEDLFLV